MWKVIVLPVNVPCIVPLPIMVRVGSANDIGPVTVVPFWVRTKRICSPPVLSVDVPNQLPVTLSGVVPLTGEGAVGELADPPHAATVRPNKDANKNRRM
jgi:hypothetical protein